MSDSDVPCPFPAGKIPNSVLGPLLAQGPAPGVRIGPALGEDACALEVGGKAVVVATDPITLTGSEVGAHAVWINANDVAVMGARPRWYLATALLPLGTTADELSALFASTRRALDQIGATLVGGHTEVTPAVNQPVVVGQMIGIAEFDRLTPTGGIQPGDGVVQIGAAPIEGAAVLAAEIPDLEGRVARDVLARAHNAIERPGISVVDAALLCGDLGATAMHDPTEGGLSAGLYELARAGGVALDVEDHAVLWFEPGVALCRSVGADPWGTLASGTLLAAFPEDRIEEVVEQLLAAGHPVRHIASAQQGAGVLRTDGAPLREFARDEVARVLEERTSRESS